MCPIFLLVSSRFSIRKAICLIAKILSDYILIILRESVLQWSRLFLQEFISARCSVMRVSMNSSLNCASSNG